MIKNDLISIIIPVYNAEKCLNKSLDSVINQTYKNLEIIVINDGSTDKSLEILKEYQTIDKRITFYSKENAGVSSARNLGLEKANGKYICFIDADDYIDNNFVESLYIDITSNDCDLAMSNIKYTSAKSFGIITLDSKLLSGKEEFYKDISIYSGYIWHKMFVSEIAKKLKFDENIHLCEDLLFLIQYTELTNKQFCFNSKTLYHYCINNSDLSRFKEWNESKITILLAYKQIKQYFQKYNGLIYAKFLLDYFYYVNDIYKRYSKTNEIKQLRKEIYSAIMNNDNILLKEKFKSFIKKNMYFIYLLLPNE